MSLLPGNCLGIHAAATFIRKLLDWLRPGSRLAWRGWRSWRPPEPVRVPADFQPEPECKHWTWVPEFDLQEREAEGYGYYPEPRSGAKCYRVVQIGRRVVNEFLMTKHGVDRRAA